MQGNAGVKLLLYPLTVAQMSMQAVNAGKRVPENRAVHAHLFGFRP